MTTLQPTSNTSPDPGQGGASVNSPSNTGHSSTTSSATGDASVTTRSCIWTGFAAIAVRPSKITLKVQYARNGTLEDPAFVSNTFAIQYSLDGGSVWNDLVSDSDFDFLVSTTAELDFPLTQDTSLVQLRDLIQAFGGEDPPTPLTASATATVSNIRLEITYGINAILVGSC
jgi:hypothetical protein